MDKVKSDDYLIELINIYNNYCYNNYNYESLEILYNYFPHISKVSIKKCFNDNDLSFSDTFTELLNSKERLKRVRKTSLLIVNDAKLQDELFHLESALRTCSDDAGRLSNGPSRSCGQNFNSGR